MFIYLLIKKNSIKLFIVSLFIFLYSCDSGGNKQVQNIKQPHTYSDSIQTKQLVNSYNHGKEIFQRLCNTCHYAPEKNVLDQYIFEDTFERMPAPSEDYFVRYISDSRLLKSSGDEYAKATDEVWNNDYEHHFKDSLSKRDFYNLIVYLKVADEKRSRNQ